MKKYLALFLGLLTATAAFAAPPNGANGYPLGWNSRFQTRWTNIYNNLPTHQDYWNKLPARYKWLLTGDSQYKKSMSSITGNFCGRDPYPLRVDNTTDTLTLKLTQTMYFNNRSKGFTDNGDAIKFSATTLPAGLNSDTTYYVVNKTATTLVSGTSSTGRSYSLQDNSKNFTTFGLQAGDLIIKGSDSSAACFTGSFVSNSRIGTGCDDSLYNRAASGFGTDSYTIVRYTFQIALTPGGAPIDFTTDGSNVNYYDANDAFWKPAGCRDAAADANAVRALYNEIAKDYAVMKEAYTTTERSAIKNVLDRLADINLLISSPTLTDSDETAAAYTGVLLHAAAIRDEDSTRADELEQWPLVGGFGPNTDNTTWRGRLHSIWNNLVGGDSSSTDTMGFYIEGTHYNILSMRDMLEDHYTLDMWHGGTYWDDFLEKAPDMLDAFTYELMPDRSHAFQTSEAQDLYITREYYNPDRFAVYADYVENELATPKPYAWMFFDLMAERWGWTRGTLLSSQFWDPYATRATQSEYEAQTQKTIVDHVRGLVYWFSGFNPATASVFFSNLWYHTGYDHNVDCFNIQMWRKGDWVIDSMRGYFGTVWFEANNNFIPFGAFGVKTKGGELGYKTGSNFLYHFGSSIENSSWTGGAAQLVRELSRSNYYRRLSDNTDIVVVFDRMDTIDDTGTTYNPTHAGKQYWNVPSQMTGFANYNDASSGSQAPRRFVINKYKHQLNWWFPVNPTSGGGGTWTWTGNAGATTYSAGTEQGKLTVFIDDDAYTAGSYNATTTQGCTYYRGGTATSTTANKLVDSTAAFSTTASPIGRVVENHDTGAEATITAIDSTTQLSLSADIITSGQHYSIHSTYPCFRADADSNRRGYILRVAPDNIWGMTTAMSVIQAKSAADSWATLTPLASTVSGEDSRGVLIESGSDKIALVFNATRGDAVTSVTASDIRDQLNNKRRFKVRTELTLGTNGTVEVNVFDLDPTKVWTKEVNGTSSSLTVDSEGIATFTINADGGVAAHTLVVSSTSECTTIDWRGCLSQSTCEGASWHWYGGVCNEDPEPQCNETAWADCATQSECENAKTGDGWYWYNSTCNQNPQPTCSTDWTLCASQGTCEAANWFWYNSTCNQFAQSATCDINHLSLCTDQASCEAVPAYWYSLSGAPAACHANQNPGQTTTWTIYPSADVFIDSSAATTNQNVNHNSIYSSSGTKRSVLYAFDVSLIPVGSQVQSVELRAYHRNAATAGETVYAYKLLKSFGETTATWNTTDGSTAWSTAGARGSNTDFEGVLTGTPSGYLASVVTGSNASGGQPALFTSTTAFKTALASSFGSTFNMVLHAKDDENISNQFYNKTNSTYRTRLIITTTPPEAPTGSGSAPRKQFRGRFSFKRFSIQP